ncbi:hypothetical protein K1W54_05265 [Micromonospora sp. CPCC 205371]|nr:hypothetical protein [Micromonospora sp. CPCC 205371]
MDNHHIEVFPRYVAPVTRPRLLGGALAVAGGLAASTTAGAAFAADARDRVRLRMPAPTGPHAIGTVWLHLVDRARQDPAGRAG